MHPEAPRDAPCPREKVRFAELARALTERIRSGALPVGALLPTELALCEEFQTSRHTVRAALHELQQLGFVSRRKNVGTRVESLHPTGSYQQTLATHDDLTQFGATHRRVVQRIEDIVADLDTAALFGCAGGTRWLRVSSLRLDEGGAVDPIGWTDVYIEPKYADLTETIRRSPNVLISSLIEAHYGRRIARIHQEVHAIAIDATMAAALRVTVGSPALRIIRRYVDVANRIFEISLSTHPADRFTFSMELQRNARP